MSYLPEARGPLSHALLTRLRRGRTPLARVRAPVLHDGDAQLALHCIHELAYRGLPGVDASMETDDAVVGLRRSIESALERELRELVGPCDPDAIAALRQTAAPDAPALRDLAGTNRVTTSLSQWMEAHATIEQVRELAIHRSAYQLKEADPHSWGLPRLSGRPKAAMVRIQFDEYGGGIAGASHAELFADTLVALELDPTYGRYLDRLPASTLATGNLIGLLGSTRRLLPALVGHLALFEMCSVGPMGRYSRALTRLGVAESGRRFYDVHVAADAEHEVIALQDLVGGLLEQDPSCGAEITFGARALDLVEGAFSDQVLAAFAAGVSSLRQPTARLQRPADHLRRAS